MCQFVQKYTFTVVNSKRAEKQLNISAQKYVQCLSRAHFFRIV